VPLMADKDRALWALPVYARASVLGFTREELDDILQTIQPEDMQGTSSAQEAADRLLSSVYMAVVSDVGETEGLTPQQVIPSIPGSRADWRGGKTRQDEAGAVAMLLRVVGTCLLLRFERSTGARRRLVEALRCIVGLLVGSLSL
jgi:hypothetical protein